MYFNKILVLLSILSLVVGIGIQRNFQKKYESLKKKINNALHKKKGDELFIDLNDYEYPRDNETFRQIHREQWNEYYECLKKRYLAIGSDKTVYPNAVMAFEGTSVELECQICLSPEEYYISDSIEWYFNSSANSTTSIVEDYLSERIVVTPDERNLIMYNVQPEQSGRYWCKLESSLGSPYFLYVNNGSEPTEAVRPNEAPKGPHAKEPTIVPRYNLKIYTEWTKWSSCSECNVIGKQIRYGYCTMSLLEEVNHRLRRKISLAVSNNDENTRIQRDDKEEEEDEEEETTEKVTNRVASFKNKANLIFEKDVQTLLETILPVFSNKLPCRSSYTPMKVQEIPEVKGRKSEIMTRLCKKKCPKNVIFEVRDKDGNVIETANNSAGIYSMLQGIPNPPPTIERTTLYKKHGSKVVLKCPGNLNSNTPMVWKIGKQIIDPTSTDEQTNGRVSINPQMQIVIKKLRFADKGLYSCWQGVELAGTIRLEVSQDLEVKFNQNVFIAGAIITLIVILRIFWKAFRGRKRFTKH